MIAALGAQPVRSADTDQAAPSKASPSTTAASAVTQHVLTVNGEKLAYTATAGYIPITDDAGKLQANIFYVAYVRKDTGASDARPITFAFNGGPGASSMWLHLGIGPKRAVLDADGTALPRAIALADNEATWLNFTDLVFVDPIGTGYSRTADGVDARQFYEISKDIQIAGSFVRRYIVREQRWRSPKFLVGESYGTTRVAGLTGRLQDAAGIDINGVILVSSVLDFQTIGFDAANDLPFALVLPSYAATAWYHHKPADGERRPLGDTLASAEQWAMSEYLVALAKGDSISEAERDSVLARLTRYSGLTREDLGRRLRIGPLRFGKRLLRADQHVVGRFDGRVTSVDASPGTDYNDSDPAFFLITGPLVQALNDYLQRDLQFRTDQRYEYLSKEANHSWKFLTGGQGYAYVADDLAEAMSRDNRLRVFAAAGYYDLATPYLAQKYTFDHMGLAPEVRSHLTFVAYPSGHQIYTDPGSARKLMQDVGAFVKCTMAGEDCSVRR
jgi:carboxypeptidase C (cathepsin A)